MVNLSVKQTSFQSSRAIFPNIQNKGCSVIKTLSFIVPGRAVPCVRTTQRQKYVCKYYARYQDYKAFFGMIAKHARNKHKGDFYADKGTPVALEAIVYLAGKRRVDVDNLLKTFMDACNQMVWNDDSQVQRAYVEKEFAESAGQERVEITITMLD